MCLRIGQNFPTRSHNAATYTTDTRLLHTCTYDSTVTTRLWIRPGVADGLQISVPCDVRESRPGPISREVTHRRKLRKMYQCTITVVVIQLSAQGQRRIRNCALDHTGTHAHRPDIPFPTRHYTKASHCEVGKHCECDLFWAVPGIVEVLGDRAMIIRKGAAEQ